MKTLSTINVIHFTNGNLQTLTAFADTQLGNHAAEEHFKLLIKIDYPTSKMKFFIENGSYTDGAGNEILLVHSDTTPIKEEFIPSKLTMEDIEIGTEYNCHPNDGDFENEFVGTVIIVI